MKKHGPAAKVFFSAVLLSVALTNVAHSQVLSFSTYESKGKDWLAELERGAPANRVEVLSDVSINRIELFTGSLVDYQLHFFIYDVNNDIWIYKSNAIPLNGSNYFHWKSSDSFPSVTLKAGGTYYIGAIPAQGANIIPHQNLAWPYTVRSKLPEYIEGNLKIVAQNAVVRNHLDPYIHDTASVMLPLRLYEALAVSTTTLPDAVQNESYGPVDLASNADKSKLHKTWSLLSGPPGLSLTPEGLLSGSSTQSGNLSLEVEVSFTQESGVVASARKTLPLKVDPASPPLKGATALPVPLLGKTGLGILMGLTMLAGLFRIRRGKS